MPREKTRFRVQSSVPKEMLDAIESLSEQRFNGVTTDAIAHLLARGLEAELGQKFDAKIDDRPERDDVAKFRDWLIQVVQQDGRYASMNASIVRAAIRSGNPRDFIEGKAGVSDQTHTNRLSAWRYWMEYVISNGIDWHNVRVAGQHA
jgi:hypothetical protein